MKFANETLRSTQIHCNQRMKKPFQIKQKALNISIIIKKIKERIVNHLHFKYN